MANLKVIRALFCLTVSASIGLVGPVAVAADPPYPPKVDGFGVTNLGKDGTVTVEIPVQVLTSTQVQVSFGSNHIEGFLREITDAYGRTSYVADVNMAKVLPKKAGRYEVKFNVGGKVFYKTYTVGKAVSLKNVTVKKTSSGVSVTGKAMKNASVKISATKGGKKAFAKTVKAGSNGKFTYSRALERGKYKVTVEFVANNKYFGDKAVTKTITKIK
jgi:hypothetical protein